MVVLALVCASAACSVDRLSAPQRPSSALADTLSSADSLVVDSLYGPDGTTATTLVVCPATTSLPAVSSKLIGPEGGTIERGPFSLTVPAGALLEAKVVTLSRPASDYLEVQATVGDSAHYQFARPVRFTVNVTKFCPDITADLVPSLHAVWIDAPEGMIVLRSARDQTNGKIRFATDHFSSYGIAW
jgi:hypothetical protein